MFLLIDKPKGMTSHDVVDEVRKITGERRVGHAGTLDPNATGLLIVGVGREATKKLGELTTGTTKEYEAEIVLGENRDTDDAEGTKTEELKDKRTEEPSLREIEEILENFKGEQMQTPPVYSAIKRSGKKLYELARKGLPVGQIAQRKVNIYSIDLVHYDYPALFVTCLVSSGTYIRSLARDIGEKLETGAYLANLRRTRIGNYKVEDAKTLEQLEKELT